MVKQKNASTEQSTVKVRIIDFEMSGSDQSLQESLQTIAAALSRGGQTIQVSRQLTARAAQALNGSSAAAQEEPAEQVDDEETADIQDAQPRAVRKSAAPRKLPPVKILSGISFTDVDPPLKDFFESKNPGKNATAAYLVVAYWYKHVRGIEDLTPDHFHTAFRQVGFPTPKNVLTTMRELRRSSDGRLMAGSTPGTTAIHHLGENSVDGMGKGE